jgi:hypothetical protein
VDSPHSARTTLEKLQQFWWDVFPCIPYSPELYPYDCHVFGPVKKAHEVQRFDMDAGVQEPVTLWLHRQPWDFYRQRKVLSVTGKVQVTRQLENRKKKFYGPKFLKLKPKLLVRLNRMDIK